MKLYGVELELLGDQGVDDRVNELQGQPAQVIFVGFAKVLYGIARQTQAFVARGVRNSDTGRRP